MPAIQSDTNNPAIRPIISIKNDIISFGIIISDIICGEFQRNKSIKTENYNKALEYNSKDYGINFSEQELNQKIQEALKIMYDIKE